MTERKPPGISYETWVEHQIARGQARGDFEDLPGAGRPLSREALSGDAYDWALAKARREGVDTAAMLPRGLALRRERDELPERIVRLASEAEARAAAEDYNARVEAFWRRPAESRWAPVPGLADVEALVSDWRRAHPPLLPSPAPEVVEVRARRRFAGLVARFRRRAR
ncbi:DUF1992 domain-containing protein [Blastococcus sp. LR1]|uniref:DnaJ family domain-containing protein n=1 Tax=Blastococcus sp. LR1 TaxID=2877000 RepID=UPI001CCFBA66|nr:DUF1992 domain-containing protein [Blastococcus sp. LR1]MCA0146974.1 DUF1992 domain-containing protein [Blastococcus sp. LR1]